MASQGKNRPDRRQTEVSPLVLKLGYGVAHDRRQGADRRKHMRQVQVNERGYRVGQDHPRSKLSDDDVALILQLLEDADADKAAGRRYLKDCEIAEKFEVSKGTISNIRSGRTRACEVDHVKFVEEKG